MGASQRPGPPAARGAVDDAGGLDEDSPFARAGGLPAGAGDECCITVKPAAEAAAAGGKQRRQPAHREALLASVPEDQQLALRFERISAFVSTDYDQGGLVSSLGRCLQGSEARAAAAEKQQKQILHSVSGEMRPGEMLALMGPSGSGKTSLLSIISGRAPRAVTTSGRVTTNGLKFSKAAKRRVGFVLQDDLLYESLTVSETLGYAAALRLPRTMNAAQRAERVESVLAALGLTKCRDTIIGGFFRRGISGGERKRVSIGHELLINPAILMLDEPTSGLDSTTALHLLVTLKQLALGGRAIATTIHQPSSRLYQQLDRLMLLAEGHVVYYGSAEGVVPWFSRLGFAMPYGVNVADFLLDLAQGEVEGGGGSDGALAAAGGQAEEALPDAAARDTARRLSGSGGGKAAAVAGAPLALALVPAAQQQEQELLFGAEAITALYSSYEAFAALHGAGYDGGPAQLADLDLVLRPPAAQQRKHGAGAGSGQLPSSGSLLGRSLCKAGSLLGLDSRGGGADADEGAPDFGRSITRIWSSRSFTGVSGAAAASGGAAADAECGSAAGCASGLARRLGVADRGGASYSTQWRVLLQRCIKVKRFESLSGQRFLQGAVVALITGLFWWQRGRGSSLLAASDVVGLLFFELLFPAFTALFSALFTFPNDYRMLLKERASGMYRVSAFYLASALSDLPMDCALPVMFVVIIYFMGGLRLTAGAFFANVLALVLNVLVAQSLGLFLGVAFMNPKTAQTVASIIMLGFMLVGGYYVRGIPSWISWVRFVSFVYWGFNLMLKIEFAGRTYYACGGSGVAGTGIGHGEGEGEGAAAAPCTAIPNLQSALQLPTNPNDSPALEVGVLLAMLVVLRLLVYFTLRQKTKAA